MRSRLGPFDRARVRSDVDYAQLIRFFASFCLGMLVRAAVLHRMVAGPCLFSAGTAPALHSRRARKSSTRLVISPVACSPYDGNDESANR